MYYENEQSVVCFAAFFYFFDLTANSGISIAFLRIIRIVLKTFHFLLKADREIDSSGRYIRSSYSHSLKLNAQQKSKLLLDEFLMLSGGPVIRFLCWLLELHSLECTVTILRCSSFFLLRLWSAVQGAEKYWKICFLHFSSLYWIKIYEATTQSDFFTIIG